MDEFLEEFATQFPVEDTPQFDMHSMEEYTLDNPLDEVPNPNKWKIGKFSKFLGFPSIFGQRNLPMLNYLGIIIS